MFKRLLLTVAAFALCAGGAQAQVTSLDDPLHGQCTVGCVDNGTNSPITSNPPVGWSFSVSPGPQTGHQYIDFLVPDSAVPQGGAGIDISLHTGGAFVANASLVSLTPWTSGFLDTYLGVSASPSNPIGAYLPSTLTVLGNPANVNGFYVFQADLGTRTVPANNGTFTYYDANKGAQGMYIVSFLQTATDLIATANSGAIFETTAGNTINPVAAVPEPATWGMMLLGFAGLAFAFRQRRRKVGFAI